MTFTLKGALLGTALLTVSGLSAADTLAEPSTAPSDAPVIVTGTPSTDREIRAEVVSRIGDEPALRTENINVQTSDGNVYLHGAVTSRIDSERAEAVARTVPGVKEVYNALGSFGA